MPPDLYIIAGPNGAGKTTFAVEFLPNYADCRLFINADLIASGLAPFAPDTAAIRAGRLVIEQIALLANALETFGFETTLSGRAYLRMIRHLRGCGYRVTIFYLWVPEELALMRVRDRVRKGGHDIPPTDLRRRYGRSLRNFFSEYLPIAHHWTLLDNSGPIPELIAEFTDELRIIQQERYRNLLQTFSKE